MPDIQTTKTVEFSLDSNIQGTFQGPKFRMLREPGHVVVYYDSSIYTPRCIGDSGIILYDKNAQYKTNFDVVSKSDSQILYHRDNVMICATEQRTEDLQAVYYVIMADKFTPINNLYVNTESR